MKKLLILAALVLASQFAYASNDPIVLNYTTNRDHFYELVMNVGFTCEDQTSRQVVGLEGGIVKHGRNEDVLIDFIDRWMIGNMGELAPVVITPTAEGWTITGTGGPGHADYPNELNLSIVKGEGKKATISATLILSYTGEVDTYQWSCYEFSLWH